MKIVRAIVDLLQGRQRVSDAVDRTVLDTVSASVAVIDRDGGILAVNAAWNKFAMDNGPSPGTPAAGTGVGANYLAAIRPGADLEGDHDARKSLDGVRAVINGDLPRFTMDYACHGPDRQYWCKLDAVALAEPPGCVVIYHFDITERVRAEEKQRIAAIAFELHSGVIITDRRGLILQVNRAFTRMTGYTADEVMGKTPALLASGRCGEAFYKEMWRTLHETGHWEGEMWNRRKSGEICLDKVSISAVTSPGGSITHFVAAYSDITQEKTAESRIHWLSYYDSLTQLPNRRFLYDAIGESLMRSKQTGHYGALFCLDLDHFKDINDTLGHEIGDTFLIEAARRMKETMRDGDTAARISGDGFAIVVNDLSPDARQAASLAGSMAERLSDAIAQPHASAGSEFHCTASIGVALFHGLDESVDAVFKSADMAMYQAKETGNNGLRFFDPSIRAALVNRISLDSDLRRALERAELHLQYQPQVDGNGMLIGAEALLRWSHPVRGAVSPADFIPLAEENGLILPIGLWVLTAACAQIKAWEALPHTGRFRLAVNVSARQFQQADFVDQVRSILARTGARPSRLKIELTESMVLDNVDETLEKMQVLKNLGIGFSLDDFGTGNSCLSYLTRLPLEQLKIDRSFVRNLPESRSDAVIAQTIIAMAKGLGLDVIAEGVETAAQRAFLVANGCLAFQGYLFSRPLNLGDFDAFVARSCQHEPERGFVLEVQC